MTAATTATLTKLDRCDRCGAEAKHRFRKGDYELLFCQHHTDAASPALENAGFMCVESKEAEE